MSPIHDASSLPVGGIGFDLAAQFRRSLLQAARDDGTIQDRIDCAELAIVLGMHDAARAIYDIVFVQMGFSPARLAWQGQIAARTGLWPNDLALPAAAEPATAAVFSISRAIAEIGGLIEAFDDLPALPQDRGALVADLDDSISPVDTTAAVPPTLEDIGGTCARLCTLLRDPADPAAIQALADLLGTLAHRYMARGMFDIRAHVADAQGLVAVLVANDLRRFLTRNRALAFAPFGSAGLLHATARYPEGTVGPYFSNVPMLIRGPRDILGLIQLAAPGDAQTLDRWTVLLSSHLPAATLLDLIDELGDLGATDPLWGLLLAVIWRSGSSRDRGPLWRIRDAALDNLDLALGAAAQRVIALWAVDDAIEWRILGDIHVTNGDPAGAMEAYNQVLAFAPRDGDVIERVRCLNQNMTEGVIISRGFGTPRARQLLRIARRRTRAERPAIA